MFYANCVSQFFKNVGYLLAEFLLYLPVSSHKLHLTCHRTDLHITCLIFGCCIAVYYDLWYIDLFSLYPHTTYSIVHRLKCLTYGSILLCTMNSTPNLRLVLQNKYSLKKKMLTSINFFEEQLFWALFEHLLNVR